MNSYRMRFAGLGALVIGLSAGVAWAQDPATLIVASEQDPLSIDPIGIDTGDYLILPNTETLVTIHVNPQKLTPLLATSWEGSQDAKTWTFKLREGIKFQDGTPFNADAVKFTMDRVLDPNLTVNQRGEVDIVTSVKVLGEYEIQFELSEPRSFFPLSMTESVTGIISPSSIGKDGNTYERLVTPVGTGPYKITSYVRGQQLEYEANHDYWGAKPNYDKVTYKFVGQAPVREAMLRAGEVNVALSPPPSSLEALKSSGFTVETPPSSTPILFALNTTGASQKLMTDVRVRQALNYAIDKKTIGDSLLPGMWRPLTSSLADTMPGYCEVGNYDYDPEKARALLAEAGATGLSVKMKSPNGRYLQDLQVANAAANYLREIGITVDGPQTREFGEYVDMLWSPPSEGDWDMALIAFNAAPHAGRAMFYANGARIPPNGSNIAGYDSPIVNKLLTDAYSNVNEEEAAKLYCDAQHQIWNDAPWVFLWSQANVFAHDGSVEGYTILPNFFAYFLEAKPVKR